MNYAIQADGTVDVVWEGDVDFGEPDNRGFIHLLTEREPWDQDREQVVRYGISDVEVSSPTGAPTPFEVDLVEMGGVDYVELRIGDEDQPFQETRHTYRIAYTLDGAMREFDGRPELFWDINTADELPIDELQVTVTAPEGVAEARCLQGSGECEVSVDGGTATYRASGVEGEIVSVVAGMTPGSVAVDEPNLQPRSGPGPARRDRLAVAQPGRAGRARPRRRHGGAVPPAPQGRALVRRRARRDGPGRPHDDVARPEPARAVHAAPRVPSEPTRAHLDGLRATVDGAMPTGDQRVTTSASSKGGGWLGKLLIVGVIALFAAPIAVILWGRFVDPLQALQIQRIFTPAVLMSIALVAIGFFVAVTPAGWVGAAIAKRFDQRESRRPRGSAIRAQAEGFRQ